MRAIFSYLRRACSINIGESRSIVMCIRLRKFKTVVQVRNLRKIPKVERPTNVALI